LKSKNRHPEDIIEASTDLLTKIEALEIALEIYKESKLVPRILEYNLYQDFFLTRAVRFL